MAQMERRVSLGELIRSAGITPVTTRQPCLPAPSQPSIPPSAEDHAQARAILIKRRQKNPESKDAMLKRIFKSSKEKEKAQDTAQWEFSQDELDQALSAIIRNPDSSPMLVQAFLGLGAKVNFIDTSDKKKLKSNAPNSSLRRRSTVLQQAATLRKADSVNILACSGADQTTLDEGLRAALAAKDQACVQELLRHGADINKFPQALAHAVQSNDQDFVLLLLRAPKALHPEIISSCLPVAVQQNLEPITSLLIGYGADPNFDSASGLNMAIGKEDWKMTLTLVAGPIPLAPQSLQRLLDTVMRLRTSTATLQFLQLLFCCGLPPASIGLPDLLICCTRKDDTAGSLMMIYYGVPTTTNEAECLKLAIVSKNWILVDAILETPIQPQHASAALANLPVDASQTDKLRIVQALVHKGASGRSLDRWLNLAIEEGDISLLKLLLKAGASVDSKTSNPVQLAVASKNLRCLRVLLDARPSPETLAKSFLSLKSHPNYSASERLEISQSLLDCGARGIEVDQTLIDAAAQGDEPTLRLLCNYTPSSISTSAALPFIFDPQGRRHSMTYTLLDILLPHGVEDIPALKALQTAIQGGPENLDVVQRLLAANPRFLGPALEYTIALEDASKKTPIMEELLKMGIPQEALDKALTTETQHAAANKDLSTTTVLMNRGASVSGDALETAVSSGNNLLTKVLLSGKRRPSRSDVTKAFRILFLERTLHNTTTDINTLPHIARQLLEEGVEQPAVAAALRAVLDIPSGLLRAEVFIDILLQYNANVNSADGVCFLLAAQKHDASILEKLLLHQPNFSLVISALLGSKIQDQLVVTSIKTCFKYGCTSNGLDLVPFGERRISVLIMAMRGYPRNAALLKLLLDRGWDPDITIREVIDPTSGEENISALLWALLQPQKRISDTVVLELLAAGASATRASSTSDITPIFVAAREGRSDIVRPLLEHGADASTRDKWNRSALFYASSTSATSVVQILATKALKNDGSLHESARCLQLDAASILIKHGHNPNFPSRLHGGRSAFGELCLHAEATNGQQRATLRHLIRLLLDNGADPLFRARNEKSSLLLALDNVYSALEVTEALLETEIWETLNDEKHIYHSSDLSYSPLKYAELIPAPHRTSIKCQLLDLFRDKGCEPRFYSSTAEQPPGATGIPAPIARLVDRQKEHILSLKHAQETHEHIRTLEETTHRAMLRRQREKQDADFAAQDAAQAHWQKLEQQKHDFEVYRVQAAERMKRSEKVAWHNLLMEQERDAAATRQKIEERRTSLALLNEAKMAEQRKSEIEHRAGVERRMLKEKEELYKRNVARQKELTQRLDESAQLHARLKQEMPAIEGSTQWGTVD